MTAVTESAPPGNTARLSQLAPDDLGVLLMIRHFELALLDLFSRGRLNGTTHTCLGQEYIPVALYALLDEGDFIFSNHRGHGHYLARFRDPAGLLAEIMGRAGAICNGVGGSQHIYRDRYLSTGVQGESLPVAAGVALHLKRAGDGEIAVVHIGDGTWGEGAVYEALNMARLWSLPLLVVVENNGIAQSTPTRQQMAGTVSGRAAAFSVGHHLIGSCDVNRIRDELAPVVGEVRSERRPHVVEFATHRIGPHSKGDDPRPAHVLRQLAADDWYRRYQQRFPRQFAAADRAQREVIASIVSEVSARPLSRWEPAARRAGAVAVREQPPAAGAERAARQERAAENLNRALHALLDGDSGAYVIGEDIADPYGGAFKVTKGLSSRHPDRVLSSPLSESAIVGLAAGLALAGNRPVVELMFSDFAALGFDQLLNFASKSVSMYGRRIPMTMVVRCPSGGNRGYGPTHSQSIQKHFIGIPGLSLYEMSPFHDNGAVLASMLDREQPCLLFEDKVLYTRQMYAGGVVDDVFRYAPGPGIDPVVHVYAVDPAEPDWVIIAPGGLVHRVLGCARSLLIEEELTCELLVPSRLYPFDVRPLLPALGRARRICVVEDSAAGGTWGELLADAIHRHLWGKLSHPVLLVSAPASVVPAAVHLEREVVVQESALHRTLAEAYS